MEPELQKFSAVALVGLLAFFPVFNQVKDTALEALTDADHEAKWGDFFKSWDNVPEDERLEYWDGRNKPPGAGDGFDGKVDEDAHIKNGGEGGNGGDKDPDDGEPTDENETEEGPAYRLVEEVLWEQRFSGLLENDDETIEVERHYESLNVTWDYSGWTGHAEFTLTADGSQVWQQAFGTQQLPEVADTDDGRDQVDGTGTTDLKIAWDYNPYTTPNRFEMTLLGTYREYLE